MVANTIFQAHITYFTLQIALNIQVNVSYKTRLKNILICMLAQVCVLLLTRFTFFKNSFNKCLEL